MSERNQPYVRYAHDSSTGHRTGSVTYHAGTIEGMGSTIAAVTDIDTSSSATARERNDAAKVAVGPRSSLTAICGTVVLAFFEEWGGGGECHQGADEGGGEVHGGCGGESVM